MCFSEVRRPGSRGCCGPRLCPLKRASSSSIFLPIRLDRPRTRRHPVTPRNLRRFVCRSTRAVPNPTRLIQKRPYCLVKGLKFRRPTGNLRSHSTRSSAVHESALSAISFIDGCNECSGGREGRGRKVNRCHELCRWCCIASGEKLSPPLFIVASCDQSSISGDGAAVGLTEISRDADACHRNLCEAEEDSQLVEMSNLGCWSTRVIVSTRQSGSKGPQQWHRTTPRSRTAWPVCVHPSECEPPSPSSETYLGSWTTRPQ